MVDPGVWASGRSPIGHPDSLRLASFFLNCELRKQSKAKHTIVGAGIVRHGHGHDSMTNINENSMGEESVNVFMYLGKTEGLTSHERTVRRYMHWSS